MITSGEWLTTTRATGMAAYGVAFASCAIAWNRARLMRRARQPAGLLALMEGTLLLDVVFSVRWMLHAQLMNIAQRWHDYDMRRGPQVIAVAVLVGLFLCGILLALRIYRARTGALLAVSGAMLSVALWCIEVVSLHAVDHILYHLLGSLMVIGIVWIFACMATSIGILMDSRPIG